MWHLLLLLIIIIIIIIQPLLSIIVVVGLTLEPHLDAQESLLTLHRDDFWKWSWDHNTRD